MMISPPQPVAQLSAVGLRNQCAKLADRTYRQHWSLDVQERAPGSGFIGRFLPVRFNRPIPFANGQVPSDVDLGARPETQNLR